MLNFRSIASGSKGNVNIITDGDTSVMLDCGLPWRKVREAMGFNTASIAGILVSHSHKDHCVGVNDSAAAGIDIYLSQETMTEGKYSGHRFHVICHGKPFQVGNFRAVSFPLVHDVACCGFIVSGGGEKAAYITDTAFVPNRMPPSLNVLAIECNFCEEMLDGNVASGAINKALRHRVKNSHMGLGRLVEFLRANDLTNMREIHLLHLSDSNSSELRIAVEIADVCPSGIKVFIA